VFNIRVERGEKLERELWIFAVAASMLGSLGLRLISYHQQARETTRHKWKGHMWDQTDERRYHSKLDRPTHIPPDVLHEARTQLAELAMGATIYIGWLAREHIYKEEVLKP
jgi:hypothetical protein